MKRRRLNGLYIGFLVAVYLIALGTLPAVIESSAMHPEAKLPAAVAITAAATALTLWEIWTHLTYDTDR